MFKQRACASNTVCPKQTFVLANCAYARKCLKPGPGQVSTGRNFLKWSIWRCSTTRLCFWGISIPGFGHAFTGKPNGAQLHHTPMRRQLTSHIWTPVCQTHHLATWLCWIHLSRVFPHSSMTSWLCLMMLISSYKWHKKMLFTCLCNGVSSFCPMKSPTPVLSQKEMKNDKRRNAWLLLW